MRSGMVSVVKGYVVSLALLGVVGCAVDEGNSQGVASQGDSAQGVSEGVASAAPTEQIDSERAAAIADAKMATLDADAITPELAACGTPGFTVIPPELVLAAAVKGPANQRSGSSPGCAINGVLQPFDVVLYFCWTAAPDGTWTYNQNLRTGVRGWTRDDLLRAPLGSKGGGAEHRCLLPLL